MKQGKKLLRSHKEMLVKLGLDPNNYLLERRGIDENGERFVNLINLKTNKVEKYSMQVIIMDLSKKKYKITKDPYGNEVKTYKLTKEELEEYLKKFDGKGKTDDNIKI